MQPHIRFRVQICVIIVQICMCIHEQCTHIPRIWTEDYSVMVYLVAMYSGTFFPQSGLLYWTTCNSGGCFDFLTANEFSSSTFASLDGHNGSAQLQGSQISLFFEVITVSELRCKVERQFIFAV